MLRDMNTYFSPFLAVITKTVMYKKGILIPISIVMSAGIEVVATILETNFLGVSTSFLLLISVMFIGDFITGVMATKHEEGVAIKEERHEDAVEKKFHSSKINFTFFKFIMLFLWIWLADSIAVKIEGFDYVDLTYSIITTIPLVLVTLREYISIGENIERKYGKKPYIFTLVEKIFDALQGKFIKKIEE